MIGPLQRRGEEVYIVPVGKSQAIISAADAERIGELTWFLSDGYAVATSRNGERRRVLMHRLIINAPPSPGRGKGLEVDHINGDRLDNRRSNLRLVTRSQNIQNRRAPWAGSSTGVRGVAPTSWGVGYWARVHVGGKTIRLGSFPTIEQAAEAAAEGRRRYMTHAPECDG